ncbi:HNH endonuclease [Bradyrhizobium sp. CCGUVB1N3]|uniref:HNH endonuclease n=1 Tax=Bradyrhizobium sp. CCGUVB1N3 TaxID=2949629 RepID=UPI0020B2FCB2|nr:HNH endonuclease [Bradyrhizobium sp. CCGUVB1N3]MCP3476508.1 HNH endonuclease [Bradyrhizobium sp. CCGUVB1N3]
MIRLTKGLMPARLQRHAAQWTQELLAAIAAGEKAEELRKSKYNHKDIKDAIKGETHNKCAYCESNPNHVTFGDIEHILPKSVKPELTYDWSNLTLACDICNTKKRDNEGFIDPYTEDPGDHLQFLGPMLRAKDEHGRNTSVGLDLNRIALIERRHEKLQDLERRLIEIKAAQNHALKETLLARLWPIYAA